MGFQWESVNKNTDISQKWTYSLEKKSVISILSSSKYTMKNQVMHFKYPLYTNCKLVADLEKRNAIMLFKKFRFPRQHGCLGRSDSTESISMHWTMGVNTSGSSAEKGALILGDHCLAPESEQETLHVIMNHQTHELQTSFSPTGLIPTCYQKDCIEMHTNLPSWGESWPVITLTVIGRKFKVLCWAQDTPHSGHQIPKTLLLTAWASIMWQAEATPGWQPSLHTSHHVQDLSSSKLSPSGENRGPRRGGSGKGLSSH